MRIYGTLIAETSFGYRLFLYRGANFGQDWVVPEKGRGCCRTLRAAFKRALNEPRQALKASNWAF